MDIDHSRELDQFFDFELASGPNGLDIGQFQENDLLAADLPSSVFAKPAPTTSYDAFPGDHVTCSASPVDAFESMIFPEMDDLPINVPSFWRPAAPCDYCASRQLDCFFLIENQDCCNSCTSLFRPCSFSNPAARVPRGYLDTLSSVAEDFPQDTGLQTSTKPLFSLGASMNDILDDIMKSKPDRTTTRFPRSTTLVLRKWLDAHADHPYPTEDEKEALKDETGLTRNQIANWLANARRRGKVRPRRCVSPSIQSTTASLPINIPRQGKSPRQADLTPFERWKESPPENEPAAMSDITRAASNVQFAPEQFGSSSKSHSAADPVRSSSGGSALPAPSVSSLETGRSGRSSGSLASTNGSSYSYGSRSSYNSHGGRDRRRRRRTLPKIQRYSAVPVSPRIFQCTFCTDTFPIKYDWSRHEKSLHLSLEKWRCAPIGPVVTSSADGTTQCVYCGQKNPTADHIEQHNHSECEEKGLAARTFFRKDHLRQHLRLIHNVPLAPHMEAWKSGPETIRSRCGFCPSDNPTTFTTWQDRADHLAKHFREGAKMVQWKGDWGFDPEIAAQVTNAMPPWMIGEEANTLDPFRAAYSGGAPSANPDRVALRESPIQQGEFALGRATKGKVSTCWEVLTVMLGQFVKSQPDGGQSLTDQDLQRQARMILYGEDDEWNQTAADNAEWLRLFKQAHGLGDYGKGSVTGGSGSPRKRDSVGSELASPSAGPSAVAGGDAKLQSPSPQDEVDSQFHQAFEDAGLFDGMDLTYSAPPMPHLSASAPAAAPTYLGGALWSLPQTEDDFGYDFENNLFDEP